MKILNILFFSIVSFSIIAEVPDWVNDTSKVCKKSQLCAIGESVGRMQAEAEARKGIAKIFQTEIQSKFSVETLSHNDQLNESVSSEIQESTNEVLEGVEIIKRYEGKDSVFALASLDKRKAARGLKNKIDEIDEKMKVFSKQSDARSAIELKKLFVKRDPLESRYQFLTGQSIRPPVSFEDVYEKRKNAIKGIILHVNSEGKFAKDLGPFVISNLVNMDYPVHRLKNQATHFVNVSLTEKEEYLKVSGFKKFSFQLDVSAKGKKGNQVGALEHEVSATGRNLQQAYSNALPQIKTYLEENLANLNIE